MRLNKAEFMLYKVKIHWKNTIWHSNIANLLSKLLKTLHQPWYVVKAWSRISLVFRVWGRAEGHGSNGQDQSDRRRAGQKEEQTSFVEGQGATWTKKLTPLVGGETHMFCFPCHIWDVIRPIDELIFFKMVLAPPTSPWFAVSGTYINERYMSYIVIHKA